MLLEYVVLAVEVLLIISTTAKTLNIPWLTIDYKFTEFLEGKGFETRGVALTPRNFRYL